MEKLLTRLARQLDALDEASLMSLWSKYATIASRFEPTQRWEEAVLVFSMIQAKRYKNQLFNYYWAQQAQPHEDGPAPAAQPLAPRLRPDAGPGGSSRAAPLPRPFVPPRAGRYGPLPQGRLSRALPALHPAHKKLTLRLVQHGPGRLPHLPACPVRRQPPDSPCLFLRVVRNLRTPDTASGIANPGG